MKSVLIVCYFFVPHARSFGSVHRVVTLTEFLHARGWQVFVLASDGAQFGYYGYERIAEMASIRYLHDPIARPLWAIRNGLADGAKGRPGGLLALARRLGRALVGNVAIPDVAVPMVPRYVRAARQIIRGHGVCNVLVSSPPHSTQLVGYRLKRQLGNEINYIADYRDSWNTRGIFRKGFRVANAVSRRMERAVLGTCDHLTYVSAPMLDKLSRLYGDDLVPKAHLIMNGFGREHPRTAPRHRPTDGKIRIGYFGVTSDRRTAYVNVSNLLRVLRDTPSLRDTLHFEFYGPMTLEEHDPTEYPQIERHGNLPHHAALERMADMDFLLLLYSDPASSDEVITGKFFDYVSVRRPILCISPRNMEARRLVERYRLGVTIDIDDLGEMREKLAGLPTLPADAFYRDVDLTMFRRVTQYERLLTLLR